MSSVARQKWLVENADRVRAYKTACYHRNKHKWVKDPEVARRGHRRGREKWQRVVQDAKNRPCSDCGQEYPYYLHGPRSRARNQEVYYRYAYCSQILYG